MLVAAASVPAAGAVPAAVLVSVVVVVDVEAAVDAAVSVPVAVAVLAPEELGVLLSPPPLQAAREATRAILAPARAKFLRFNIRSVRLLLIPDEFVPLTALSD